MSGATAPTRPLRRHCADSRASRPGCGGTPTSSIFVIWQREHNDRLGGGRQSKTGFYGLDLYSLYRSVHDVISYLDRVDVAAAARARERYAALSSSVATTPRSTGSLRLSGRARDASQREWSNSATRRGIPGRTRA